MTGNEVLAARQRLGLTQEELAAKLGVTTRTISRWETGGCPQIESMLLTRLVEEEAK